MGVSLRGASVGLDGPAGVWFERVPYTAVFFRTVNIERHHDPEGAILILLADYSSLKSGRLLLLLPFGNSPANLRLRS